MPVSSVLETLADLVRINSVNPAYEGGHPEQEVVRFLRGFFEGRGIECWEQPVLPERPNLIARVPGRNSGRRIVFEAHTDTVSAGGMDIEPFVPAIRDGRLYGRGSCDNKGGLAAMMHAIVAAASSAEPPPCEVWLAATVDEEHSFRGVSKLCEGLDAHAAVVAEPTSLRAVIASKGVLRWRIRTVGRAAHSSKPHLGVNAITAMSHLVLALEEENRRLSEVTHPLLGPATNNVGIIRGGRQINFVPDECSIEIDRRLIPGEEIPNVLARYQEVLEETAKRFPGFHAEMEPPMLEDYPLETPPGAGVVEAAQRVLERLAIDPEPMGVPYGSDASKFSRKGVPAIVLGPGSIDQAHAAVEFVDCGEVERAVEIYLGIMQSFE